MKKISTLLIFILVGVSALRAQNFNEAEKAIIQQGDRKSKLPVYQVTDSKQQQVLLSQSTSIDPKDPLLPLLIDRMKLSVLDPENQGVGIAAPQVGINRRLVIVQRFDKPNMPLEYFINPQILWHSSLFNYGPEGDLSIPDFRNMFYRSQAIQLEYFTTDGQKHTEMVEGFTAVIFQHEIDHLSGILISEKLKEQAKNIYQPAPNFFQQKVDK